MRVLFVHTITRWFNGVVALYKGIMLNNENDAYNMTKNGVWLMIVRVVSSVKNEDVALDSYRVRQKNDSKRVMLVARLVSLLSFYTMS